MPVLTQSSLVLRLEPNDADATQTKLFLLLHTEQYETALSIIGDGHDFEKTYSLYRLQREEEAQAGLDTLKAMHKDQDEDSQEAKGVMHLEAQLVCFPLLLQLSVSHLIIVRYRTIARGRTKLPSTYTINFLIQLIV